MQPVQASLLAAGLFLIPLLFRPEGGSDLVVKRLGLFILVTALAVVWAKRPVITRDDLLLPGICYVLLSIASTFWAPNPLSSVVEIAPLFIGLILLVAITSTVDVAGFLRACTALVIGGGVVGMIGIAQYFDIAPFTGIPSVGLPSATFGFRNVTAGYLVTALPLAALGIFAPGSDGKRLVSLAGTTLMGVLLVYTRTRGAWLGLAVGSGVIVALSLSAQPLRTHLAASLRSVTMLRRWGLALLILMACYAATRSENSSDAAIQRFDEQKTSALTTLQSTFDVGSGRGRLTFWRNTLDLIRDHPVLGVGLDNWEYVYPPYDRGMRITAHSEPARPHNDLLWITSEIGLVGLLVYVWLLLQAGKGAWEASRASDPTRALLGIACAGSLAAFTVHGFFSFPKEQPATVLLFWTALTGLAIARRKDDHRTIWIPRWMGSLTAAVCLLAFCAGWQHFRFDGPFHRALAATQGGNWELATREIGDALTRGPIDHRASFIRAKALHEQGRWSEAEAAYTLALAYHPNYANTHHNLAGILAQQGDLPTALQHFEIAHQLRPTDSGIQINLGNALIRAGRFDQARVVFQSLIADTLAIHQAHAALGAIELYQQNPTEAIPHLEHAVALKPDFNEARNNLAIALEQSGRLREAVAMYEVVIQGWRGDPAYLEQIRAHVADLKEQGH